VEVKEMKRDLVSTRRGLPGKIERELARDIEIPKTTNQAHVLSIGQKRIEG
jgi:hypothetical protein